MKHVPPLRSETFSNIKDKYSFIRFSKSVICSNSNRGRKLKRINKRVEYFFQGKLPLWRDLRVISNCGSDVVNLKFNQAGLARWSNQ